jgi:peptidoglycan/xylan/chitin deacetylase (PgdA/CDA1 family)
MLLLIFVCGCKSTSTKSFTKDQGAIVRGDSSRQQLTLVFTGHEFADGLEPIRKILSKHKIKAAFFFTGSFYRNPNFKRNVENLIEEGHYLGAHSNDHLLYCDWNKRDSLLVTHQEFLNDLKSNYKEMARFGITKKQAPYFLPPYEWYNDSIAEWTADQGLQLINMTNGTLSHADYTTPDNSNYRSSEAIYNSILDFESKNTSGLKGFLLLMHVGTEAIREDKFYKLLEKLILELKAKKYDFIGLKDILAKE